MKVAESYFKGSKTLWEKEKLLVTSNFSFSQSVFKGLVLQTRKNQGLFGKGLNLVLLFDFKIELTLSVGTKDGFCSIKATFVRIGASWYVPADLDLPCPQEQLQKT